MKMRLTLHAAVAAATLAIAVWVPIPAAAVTMTASAQAQSALPAPVPNTQNLQNGDFLILGNLGGGATGDGVDETTRWSFDFSANPSYATFIAEGGVALALLTITLHTAYFFDGVGPPGAVTGPSDGVTGIFPTWNLSGAMTGTFGVYTRATFTTDLIANVGMNAGEVFNWLASHSGQFPMLFADDAIVVDSQLTLVSAPVPEPAVWGLWTAGLLALGAARRRARRFVRKTHLPSVLAASLAGAASMAQATELGRQAIAPGSYMVSSCAGQRPGNGSSPGDLGGWYVGMHQCNASQSSTAGGSVAESAFYTHPLVNEAVANGSATMGQMKLYASFNANNQIGVGAWATAGWVDTITVNAVNPTLQGTQAILEFSLLAQGSLVGLPQGNSGVGIEIYPYINDSFIGIPEAPYAGQNFKVSGQGQGGFPYNATVNDVATFRAVVTLGTPFELGIFARATVGVAGVGPNWYSAGTVDFSHTIDWNGMQQVTVAGNPVDFSIDSLSGTPWIGGYTQPVPEAPTWMMMAAAGLLLGVLRNRSSRA